MAEIQDSPERMTRQQEAYDFMRDKITSLMLRPGEYVTDIEVADELGMSRTPVREAFHRLENEGLLINEARRGWRVYSLSLKDIHEIFDVKIAIECMISRRAAECAATQRCTGMDEAVELMRLAASTDDVNAWVEADVAFHTTIFRMAGNERAERIVANLNDQWHRLRVRYSSLHRRMGGSVVEHERIGEAIKAGDVEAAEERTREHLTNVRDDLLDLVSNLLLPFAQNGV